MTQGNDMMGNGMMNGNAVMHGCPMMGGTGGTIMMITMAVIWILMVAALLLSIAALIKYLRSGRNS